MTGVAAPALAFINSVCALVTAIQIQNPNPFNNKKNKLDKNSLSKACSNFSSNFKYQFSRLERYSKENILKLQGQQKVYMNIGDLKEDERILLIHMIRVYGLNCSKTEWISLKQMAIDIGMKYNRVRNIYRKLDRLGYIKKVWYKAGPFKTVARAKMGCVCTDLHKFDDRKYPKIGYAQNHLPPTNYLDLRKNNSSFGKSDKLHVNIDISHGLETKREKYHPPPPRCTWIRFAKAEEVMKMAENYGLEVNRKCRQIQKNIFHATRMLKMAIKDWEWVFEYAKNNPFLNGTICAFKATFKFISAIDNVQKIRCNKYEQYQSQNLKSKSVITHKNKNEIAPAVNNPEAKSQSVNAKKIWSIIELSLVRGKSKYDYIEKQFERLGILDRIKKAIPRFEVFYRMKKNDLDFLLRSI